MSPASLMRPSADPSKPQIKRTWGPLTNALCGLEVPCGCIGRLGLGVSVGCFGAVKFVVWLPDTPWHTLATVVYREREHAKVVLEMQLSVYRFKAKQHARVRFRVHVEPLV